LVRNATKLRSPAARAAALHARPRQNPPVKTEEKGEKLYVTIRFKRPGWQELLGAHETAERTFGLDEYGRGVYESCDGKLTVEKIVKRFADRNRISVPEAEMAVTKFMRTLMTKGLIAMEMEK